MSIPIKIIYHKLKRLVIKVKFNKINKSVRSFIINLSQLLIIKWVVIEN